MFKLIIHLTINHIMNFLEKYYPILLAFIKRSTAINSPASLMLLLLGSKMTWDDYGNPQLDNKRSYFHFLGKA